MSTIFNESSSDEEEKQTLSSSLYVEHLTNATLHRYVSNNLEETTSAASMSHVMALGNEESNDCVVDGLHRSCHCEDMDIITQPSLQVHLNKKSRRNQPAHFLSRVVSQDLSEPGCMLFQSQDTDHHNSNKKHLQLELNKKKSHNYSDIIDGPRSPGNKARVRIVSPRLKRTSTSSTPADKTNNSLITHHHDHDDMEHQELSQQQTPRVTKRDIANESSLSPELLPYHLKALAAETIQLPLRPILAKLMNHPIHNRKGIFNQPVDVEGYCTVISYPMDLGTIKQRLHANLYSSEEEFSQDVRKVFTNAMTYNPSSHPVHVAAMHLLQLFEEALHSKQLENNNTGVASPEVAHSCRRRISSPTHHSCLSCQGRICVLCNSGCLQLEPTLLICSGSACYGSKIRKGGEYYCTEDGNKTFCHECYVTLPSILPFDNKYESDRLSPSRYKRNLLKRRNEEEVVENWITCSDCLQAMHCICAFVDEMLVSHSSFLCPLCVSKTSGHAKQSNHTLSSMPLTCFTFLTNCEIPKEISYPHAGTYLDARTLRQDSISAFIENKIQACMLANRCPLNAEKTITVRMISDTHKHFVVPEIIQRHFKMISSSEKDVKRNPTSPSYVPYSSKAIALFQKFDGLDVCIFCLYVQEYDNEGLNGIQDMRQHKRVYIAYLDSVDYFRPRHCRTDVYQVMLTSYLATARARGYEYAQIWSCPPSRGNSFVFWAHPPSQKTPNQQRLLLWYQEALSKAMAQGIVMDVMSLYEFAFQSKNQKSPTDDIMICPPLFDGDFWIDEACRLHRMMANRLMRRAFSRKPEPCIELHTAASQIANMLSTQVMTESCAEPFLRPVNAAALKLRDYHDVIKKPMDLSTIYCRCLLGEYDMVRDVVSDVKLVVENAKLYNPKGHPIHSLADNLWRSFQTNLMTLCLRCQGSISALENSVNSDSVYDNFLYTSLKLHHLSLGATNIESSNHVKNQSSNVTSLLKYGSDDISRRMVGEDTWLLQRSQGLPTQASSNSRKRKNEPTEGVNKSGSLCAKTKFLSASWLADEVSQTIRRMRRDFFVCRLQSDSFVGDTLKERQFQEYVLEFKNDSISDLKSEISRCRSYCKIADSRFSFVSSLLLQSFYSYCC